MKHLFMLFLLLGVATCGSAQFIPSINSQLYDNFKPKRVIPSEDGRLLALDGVRTEAGGFTALKGSSNAGKNWSEYYSSIIPISVNVSGSLILFTSQQAHCQLLAVTDFEHTSQYIIQSCMGIPYQSIGIPYSHVGKVFSTTRQWSGSGDQYTTKLRRFTALGDEIVSHFPGIMQLMRFSDAEHGWYISVSDSLGPCIATQYQTSDAGTTWQRVRDFPPFAVAGDAYTRVSFVSALEGYLSCANRLYKTIDGGNHWSLLSQLPSNIADLAFISAGEGYVIMNNQLYKTTDNGIVWTWQRPINNTIEYLRGCLLTTSGGKAYLVSGDTLYVASRPTGVNNQLAIPETFSLGQNYPNPFNPSTTISFSLPRDAFVSLIVYDLLGREIIRLVDERMGQGMHSVELEAGGLSSGIYFYRIKSGSFQAIKKMLLVK